MKLFKIESGNFMADGGAIFGVIPKMMWSKFYPANDINYCNLSMRCLLIDTGDRRILIDTGVGDKQSDKFFSYHHLNGDDSLSESLTKVGYNFEDITDVVLTHLHFDHCGGCVNYDDQQQPYLAFPNATYWVGKTQWENYKMPNIREGAVYFKENMMPVFEAGRLKTIDANGEWLPGIEMRIFNGHTAGQLVPVIQTTQGKLAYMGDLIPVMASIPLAWVSAYDTDPLLSIEEKREFLKEAAENNYTLFFEHDLYNECCTVEKTEKGIRMKESFTLEALVNQPANV